MAILGTLQIRALLDTANFGTKFNAWQKDLQKKATNFQKSLSGLTNLGNLGMSAGLSAGLNSLVNTAGRFELSMNKIAGASGATTAAICSPSKATPTPRARARAGRCWPRFARFPPSARSTASPPDMHPTPLPIVPLIFSTVILGDITASAGLDPRALLERWGIAAVMGFVAWLLWKRSERQDREARQRAEALEKERLEVSKELLAEHKENAANMQTLIVGNMRSQQDLADALRELKGSVHAIPCKGGDH